VVRQLTNMKLKYLIIAIVVQLLIGVGIYLSLKPKAGRNGFVVNQQIFDGFEGKKNLELKLNSLRSKHAAALDSVELLMRGSFNQELISHFEEMKNQFVREEQDVSAKYTEDIWKEINQAISVFGKDEGYDFIYGATGNGSLMYGNNSFNVSEEVIDYLNKRYEGQK
jgi:outer membrane protein